MNLDKDRIQKEALDRILPCHRSGIVVTMGGGKSLIGIKWIQYHHLINKKLKVLVLAPKVSIFQSWKDDMVKFGMTHLESTITFSTYLSLSKQNLNWDLVICDEMHSLIMESHQEWLDQYKGRILGMTGTKPGWSGSTKNKMIDKYCPVVYEYTTDEAVEDNILNDYRIIVHKLKLNHARNLVMESKSGKKWVTSELDSYKFWTKKVEEAQTVKSRQIASIMRMKALQGFPTKEVYAKKLFNSIQEKVIIFCNTIQQAKSMCIYNYTSKTNNAEESLEKFKNGSIMRLSAVQQLSEGVNIPGLAQGIIMHFNSSASTKGKQRWGRLLRLNPLDTSTLHILMYSDTSDERWVMGALKDLDQTKITYQ